MEELSLKEEGRGGDGARRMADGIPNKKQEPHLKYLKIWEKKAGTAHCGFPMISMPPNVG